MKCNIYLCQKCAFKKCLLICDDDDAIPIFCDLGKAKWRDLHITNYTVAHKGEKMGGI